MIAFDSRELDQDTGSIRVNHIFPYPLQTRLEFGDYQVIGLDDISIGIEVKQISECVNSILSGRLADQLRGCREQFDESILITEGYISTTREQYVRDVSGRALIPFAVWHNCILSQQRCGTMVLQTYNPRHTAQTIIDLDKYYSKDEHSSANRIKRLDDSPNITKREQSLTAIPGIGPDRAKSLLRHFGTIHDIVHAPTIEIANIEGIGGVTALKIWDFFRKGESVVSE